MNTDTDLVRALVAFDEKQRKSGHIKEIDPANLPPQKQVILRKRGEVKIGRNDPCPCGSGKKYKRCCQGKKFPPPEA